MLFNDYPFLLVFLPASIAIIQLDMPTMADDYIPQLTIGASAQAPETGYRIVNSSVEFRIAPGKWRALTDEEIRGHFRLNTGVASWLQREVKNSWVWS